ncbi:hypothetical protein PG989_014250 [Apiospora arundinis]
MSTVTENRWSSRLSSLNRPIPPTDYPAILNQFTGGSSGGHGIQHGACFAVGHHLYYTSLHGQPATNQAERLRYGTLLAFLTKACLIWAVLGALRQRIWTTLQSKKFPLQGIDSLFAIADGPLAALDWRNLINAKIAVSMATIAWLGPVMVILASQSISVEPTMDKAMCPGVKTLNFSLESVLDYRNITKIDGLTSRSVSEWNTTRKGDEADFFDYWTFTSTFMKGIAWAAIYQKRAVYKPSASQEACGLDWNCRYTIRFTGPGYNCNITSAGVGSTSKDLRGNVPPFSTDILLPRGNLSYIAYATGGEYAAEQMKDEDVYFGGILKMDPPYPKSLGAFRVEPVLWVGYSSATRSGEEPYNRTQPGWDSYYTPTIFFCEMFETQYTVEFEHSGGSQFTRVLDRKYIAPIINTTLDPNVDAIDGTNDNTTAHPLTNYVYPTDTHRYRYVAAFHSIGYIFRHLINGTIWSRVFSSDTSVLNSKIFDHQRNYLPDPHLMESMQSLFEDILLSMFSEPILAAVSWAADPTRMTGEREGDETTLYPCTRWKPENRFRYHPLELGAVYAVSILLTAAAIGIGTVSVIRNGGVLKNTYFTSVATLLKHCGYSFDAMREPVSHG